MHMKEGDVFSLANLASEEYEKADGDPGVAEARVATILLNNKGFLRGIVSEIAHGAIRDHRRKIRSKYFQPIGEPETVKDAEIAAAMKRPHPWYDYPLSTGKLLGVATKSELVDEADMHKAYAAGNLRMMRIYKDIVKRLPDEETNVSTALSEDDLEEIAKNRL